MIRLLAYVYEEQAGCVRWDDIRSSEFSITNGTRQGSVLSPTLFSVYLDDLLKELRHLGLGCHVGGVWVGAAGYADDLILQKDTIYFSLQIQTLANLSLSVCTCVATWTQCTPSL